MKRAAAGPTRTMLTGNARKRTRESQASAEAIIPSPTPLEFFCISLEAGELGVWVWDLPSRRMSWTTNLEAWHGRAPAGRSGTFSFTAEDIPLQHQWGVLTAITECLRTKEAYRVEYHLPTAIGTDERWLEVSATVLVKEGAPVQVLGMSRDVSERMRVKREMRARARQQEALARLGEDALAGSDLQKFFHTVAATTADILDVELVKILELLPGSAEMLLRAGIGWPAEMIGSALVSTGRDSHAGYALAAGRPVIVEDLATETRFTGTQMLLERAVSGLAAPIAGRDGRAYGALCAHSTKPRKFDDCEISFLAAVATVVAGAIQRRELDQRHEQMIRELRHHSGNLYSQLLALFSQTAKSSRTLSELATKYEARVMVLANAHRLFTEGGWNSTSLNELLSIALASYRDRVLLRGPSVLLEPDKGVALSMAMHELVTNAAEHGSLSDLSGRVDLAWSISRNERGLVLTLDWNEHGGPAPDEHRRPGFGMRLLSMVVERRLSGKMQQTFAPEGLRISLVVPLENQ